MSIVFSYSPLAGNYVVTSRFGYRNSPGGGVGSTKHNGIDLGIPGNPDGEIDVIAVASGKVTRSAWYGGYGNCIEIDHLNGYSTLYGHLYNREVREGDSIAAGHVLGRMGNTGNSTGPHLHLELKHDGKYLDPAPYLEGGIVLESGDDNTGDFISDDNDGAPTGPADIPYTPLKIVGKRINTTTTQPIQAYVNIYLGDKLLSTSPPKPNIIQSFEFNRIEEAGSTATFSLFDDKCDEIEHLLSQYWDNVAIEYGYSGAGVASRRYLMRLTNYTVSFNNTGTLLSVSAISQNSLSNLKSINMPLNTYNPTEAVKTICKNQGWKVYNKNFDKSENVNRDNPYNLVQEYPLSYINSVIIPETRSDGEIFRFYLDDDNVAYFKKFKYTTEDIDGVRTYVYQKGYDSPVIDLTFDIKGVFGGTTNYNVSTGLTSSSFDAKTKKSNTKKETSKSTITQSTGKKTHTESEQSVPNVDFAGATEDQKSRELYYHVKNATNSQYEATMTIVGDPTINLLEDIRIINVTDSGALHHTSGIYKVKGIVDTYASGSLTTTLQLMRNGNINEGVELINPKALIK